MPDKNNNQPLSATDFQPIDAAGTERSLPISPGVLALALLATSAVIILLYLFVARAVIFQTEPENAEIEIGGGQIVHATTGSVLLIEDMTGKGHRAKVTNESEWHVMFVPLAAGR